jgi:hypothetical protein
MMSRAHKRWLAPLVALALVPAACDDDDPAGPGLDGPTTLTVLLTDAPGAVEAVWVEILEIYLQGGDDGRVTLLDESTGLIELTDLVGTTRTIVDEVEVDPASYAQLRMVIGDAVLETQDGDVYVLGDAEHPDGLEGTGELQCPSCQQSGLKVILPGDQADVEEGASVLVLDFDVAQSFGHKAGNSGRWIMRPTIVGVLIDDENGDGVPDLDRIGSLSGTVEVDGGVSIPDCPAGSPRDVTDFIPLATAQTLVDGDGLPILRAAAVAADGSFEFAFLDADDYALGFQDRLEFEGATLEFAAEVDPETVAIAEEGVGGVTYTITSATCEPDEG